MQFFYSKSGKLNRFLSSLFGILLIRRYGIFVAPDTEIGVGLRLPHPDGIIIGKCVEIGDNCTIFQQVTIGSSRPGDFSLGKQPKIGNNVWLFSGSKVLGDIKLANNTVVGANAVLLSDTQDGMHYVGVPAKATGKAASNFLKYAH